jgi:DNA polymerase III subunit delta'
MALEAVLGQTHAIGMLGSALKSDEIHHAYLFSGPDGVGKELAAIAFAQALLCERKPQQGCGECSTCTRIAKHGHPDVVWLMPEDEMIARGLAGRSDFANVPSREIKVEQVRSLQERISLRALEGRRKVAILASAEQMNPQAQNALLKALEEPPPETVLILISSAADRLLPTIRSRCSKVSFVALPLTLIASQVEQRRKLDPQTSTLIAVLSGGSLSRALALDARRLAQRKELIQLFETTGGNLSSLLSFAEVFGSSRDEAEAALDILDLWIRDLLVLKEGVADLVNRDLEELAGSASANYTPARLHRMREAIAQARERISERNGAPRFQLERMLIEMGRSDERQA